MPITNYLSKHMLETGLYMKKVAQSTGFIYLGLSTTLPNKDGSNVTEPDTELGYERKILVRLDDPITSGYSTQKVNLEFVNLIKYDDELRKIVNHKEITMKEPTASWGTCVALCLFDAQTGGNLLAYDNVHNTDDSSTTISPDKGSVVLIREKTLQIGIE